MNRPIQTLALVLTAVALATLVAPRVFAATPPTQIHYQGVLRDASDNPRNGNFDMIFRFFDLSVGGNEILVDGHEAAGSGAVTVTAGLFGAELGGGIVSDGASAGTYTSLSQVFRDFTSVFLQIQVAGETLVPRVRVLASAYALNADQLDGKDSTEFIDTSAASQTKAGDLKLGDLTVSGNDISFGSSGPPTDCCSSHGTPGCDNAGIQACVCAGDAFCCNTAWDQACANEVNFGCGSCAGGTISSVPASLTITAGDGDTDFLGLFGGNGIEDGGLLIGSGFFQMIASNEGFQFFRNTDLAETASLDSAGNLQIDGDLTVSGGDILGLGNVGFGGDLTVSGDDITFGTAGAAVHVTGSGFQLNAGNAETDDLTLVAGNSLDDGQLMIFGDGAFEMRAGSGLFQFFNGATALETASLSSAGALQIDGDLTVSGDDITFGTAGAAVHVNGNGIQLNAGDADIDDLALVAGNSLDDGQLLINGDGAFEMRAGNGLFTFVNGATALETASLGSTGDLQIAGNVGLSGDLTVSGDDITFGSAGAGVDVNGSVLQVNAGDTDTDDLALVAGNSFDDGRLLINGDGAFEMRAGNGLFQFFNGATAVETASLSSAGTLQFDGDLTVGGDDITFGTAGAAVHVNGNGIQLNAGDTDTDDLALVTGNSPDDGQLIIFGDGTFEMHAGSSVRSMLDVDNSETTALAEWHHNGTFVNTNKLMDLDESGNLRTDGTILESQTFDLAEAFFMAEAVEPGDLVAVDPSRPDAVRRTTVEADPTVLGIVSTRPGVILGGAPFDTATLGQVWGPEILSGFESERSGIEAEILTEKPALVQNEDGAQRLEDLALQKFHARHFASIALAGRVPVKVDASFGAIAVGDALAPSPVPGVAMKATKPGPIVGTALEALAHGRGTVVAFVHRGWYGGGASDAPAPGVDVAAAHKAEQAAGSVAPGVSVVYGSAPDAALEARAQLAPVPAVEAVPFAFPVKIVQEVESGDVLAADASRPGEFLLAGEMGDPLVIGIAAGEAKAIWSGRAPLALPGTLVQCKVDAAYGVIRPGDLLVASPTPGHAMLSTETKPGTVIAKALESLDFGTGTILVLVQPR